MTDQRERPILFSAEMVKAILEGRKTQTRRVLTVPWRGSQRALPYEPYWVEEDGRLFFCDEYGKYHDVEKTAVGPYGAPGDRLWVKETWCPGDRWLDGVERDPPQCVRYRADNSARAWSDGGEPFAPDMYAWGNPERWRPSIFMPRWASRITLEVTGVRVERLQDISEDDAEAEGCVAMSPLTRRFASKSALITARDDFRDLWDTINAERAPWASNPWVWVVSFEVLHGQ